MRFLGDLYFLGVAHQQTKRFIKTLCLLSSLSPLPTIQLMSKLQNVIFEEYNKLRIQYQSYSLRSFARKAGVSVATLSNLKSGRIPLTRDTAERCLIGLNILTPENYKLLGQLPRRRKFKADLKVSESDEVIEVMTDGISLSIVSMLEADNFLGTIDNLSKKMRLQKREINRSISSLKRIGLVKEESPGIFMSTKEKLSTPIDIPNGRIRNFHRMDLERVAKSLDEVPIDCRDSGAITVVTSLERIQEAKQRIREFRRSLIDFLEQGEKKEVFRFITHLIPLSDLNINQGDLKK